MTYSATLEGSDSAEAERLITMCGLCCTLACGTTDLAKIERLRKKHAGYAHRYRRIAARIKAERVK